MRCALRQSGFTLLELVVVLAVASIVVATMVPTGSSERRTDAAVQVRAELSAIAVALEDWYAINGAFPATLTSVGFLGGAVTAGVDDRGVRDDFAADNAVYRYAVSTSPAQATVWSVGPDGSDAGVAGESFLETVSSAATEIVQRQQQRLDLIVGRAYGLFGAWAWFFDQNYPVVYPLDAGLGLGSTYADDVWGTPIRTNLIGTSVCSAGPDRAFGTADDLTAMKP